ncbi:MAG: 1,4-beta-xylanase, partial [Halioglobus sp.]|nr:1,4-beta-xylanase [Halioglobus sp.]
GILERYGTDSRVAIWDLYNEPGNDNILSYSSTELDDKYPYSLALLEKVFGWARDTNPQQPLTAGVWRLWGDEWQGADPDHDTAPLFAYMLEHSDIITFHSYQDRDNTAAGIAYLQQLGRPMICTEYMARGHDSTLESIMPLFAEQDIGAIHWGFVSGKSQTIYPWSSWIGIARWWSGLFGDEPDPWHHDMLRANGSPYNQEEVSFVSSLIANKTGTKQTQ